MKINFKGVPDAEDYSPVPAGQYVCRVAKVDEDKTKNEDAMWNFMFEIVAGEHKGKMIRDRLVFSEAAMKRVKLICKRFGFNVEGELDLTPSMFFDKPIKLDVEIESYEDKEGKTKQRNSVPFAGYHEVNAEAAPPISESGKAMQDLPF